MHPRRAHRRAPAGLLLVLALLLIPAQGLRAQDLDLNVKGTKLPVNIVADEIDYESDDGIYTAEGRVRISQSGRTLTSDWVMLDSTSRIGVASGNVVLRDKRDVIHADFMEFNIDTLAGIVYRGRFEDDKTKFKITGSEIRRLSDKEYRLKEGTFTTCDCGPGEVPSWRIEGEQVDVTVDGYAKVKGAKFMVKDRPVAYVPYGIFPVKTTRQSGLLFPLIGQSNRNGFQFNLPYYWAISENTDATFYQEILGKRGYKQGAEFRYVFSPDTYGQVNGWFLNDQDVTDHDPYSPDRWAARWQHREGFPLGVYGKANVELASDNDYVVDFDDLGRDSRRFLESNGQLERPFDRGNVTAGAMYGNDLQSPDNLDRDDVVLQRLPFVQAELIDQPAFDSPLRFQWDSSFVNFHQNKDAKAQVLNDAAKVLSPEDYAAFKASLRGATFLDQGVDGRFDPSEPFFAGNNKDPDRDDFFRIVPPDGTGSPPIDSVIPGLAGASIVPNNPSGTEGDFVFEEGEALATAGQRVDLFPRVSMPFQVGKYLDVRPEIGFRETIWQSSDFPDTTTHRDLFTARLDVTSFLERDWSSPLSRWESLMQTFEPQLTVYTIQGSDDEIVDKPNFNNFFREMRYKGPTNYYKVDHPVFVPPGTTNQSRQRFFAIDNILQDESDVIPDQTVVYYTTEHQFFARSSEGDGTSYRLLRVRFGTGYDVENSQPADTIMETTLEPTDQVQLFSNVTYNNEINRLDKFNIGGAASTNRGDRLALNYRLSKSFAQTFEDFPQDDTFEGFEEGFDEISELNTNLRVRLTNNLDFLYASNYSFNVNEFFRQAYSVVYRSKCNCWSTNLSLVDRRRANDTQFRILVNLMGLGGIGNAGGTPGGTP